MEQLVDQIVDQLVDQKAKARYSFKARDYIKARKNTLTKIELETLIKLEKEISKAKV